MYMRARSSGAPGTDFPPQQPEASSGVARVAAKLLELDAAQAGVRAEEQLDLEALQRRALIEEVGLKAAQVEGLRARLAGVQARKAAAAERHRAVQLLRDVQATAEDACLSGGGGRG